MLARSRKIQKSEPTRVRCPKCRTVTATNHPSFPICSKKSCIEYLIKCRYCTWYDPETVECTNPEIRTRMGDISGRVRITDVDAYINCPEHNSAILYNPIAQARTRLVSLTRVTLSILLVCGLVYGIFRVGSAMNRRPTAPGIALITDAPGEVEAGSQFLVRMTLRNLDAHDTGNIHLRLSERFFDWFALLEIYPQPQDMFIRGAGRYFLIDSIPGNSEMLVTMRFKTTEPGVYPLKITVFSKENVIYTSKKIQVEVI